MTGPEPDVVTPAAAGVQVKRRNLLGGPFPAMLVVAGMILFCLIFGWAHIQNHRGFGTYAFDTGIYDQAVWLLGRDLNPFMTVRGLSVHGHHVNPVLFLLVPISWLGGGATWFLCIQTFTFAAGAWPVFLIARRQLARADDRQRASRDFASSLMAAVQALAYLLSPVMQWVNQAHWRPEAFSGTAFLFAWWFAINRRWTAYAIAVTFVLATREETALAVGMMGLVLLFEQRRHLRLRGLRDPTLRRNLRPGVVTVTVAAAWFLVCTKLIIPAFNDGRPPYFLHEFFATFGGSVSGVVKTVVTDPGLLVETVTKPDRVGYLLDLGLPTLFTSLASPLHFSMMLPALASNLLTDNEYARMIQYQYAATLIGPMWIATVEGLARLRRRPRVAAVVVGAVFVSTLITNVNFSPSPLSKPKGLAVWSRPDARSQTLRKAVDMVPDDAVVVATYFLVTHLDRRHYIYDWPNPFVESAWGNYDPVRPTPLPDPKTVEWIVADRRTLEDDGPQLLRALTSSDGEFVVVFDEDDVVVARRRAR